MITDAAKFAVADDLTVTGGSIVDSTAFEGGTAGGTWSTETLVGGETYKFAMILTTNGTDINVPTSGFYGVDAGPYEVKWDASTGGGFEPTHEGIYVSTAVVPEPTSGLLLLLGVGALALRRRRA